MVVIAELVFNVCGDVTIGSLSLWLFCSEPASAPVLTGLVMITSLSVFFKLECDDLRLGNHHA